MDCDTQMLEEELKKQTHVPENFVRLHAVDVSSVNSGVFLETRTPHSRQYQSPKSVITIHSSHLWTTLPLNILTGPYSHGLNRWCARARAPPPAKFYMSSCVLVP